MLNKLHNQPLNPARTKIKSMLLRISNEHFPAENTYTPVKHFQTLLPKVCTNNLYNTKYHVIEMNVSVD